ncbi:hypothetical protein PYCCODRAFT_1443665 [Trametes coccinea BRFM310]|uniref:Transcription factor IIIC putative zinc-finger domain-containing protein n=1 Tax=Trametes coccinea (strain BRFM310) TaxID=1353009 RepID=A0A1Y2IUP5_TRAC3|nr:hypothetical protein PYCCODRAFT_1443665 [Trametes coccinea BRFM310]
MSDLQMLAALRLPSVTISPSAKGLQFSGDGQVILLTKYAVYILVYTSSASYQSCLIDAYLDSGRWYTPSQSAQSLGWLRTVVEFDRALTQQWPSDCQDWGTVCLGALDPSLQAIALSPSNLTNTAGCLFALLNSNLELTIWGASKNFLTGENVTSLLKDAAGTRSTSALVRTLHAQSTCIEWSQQPDWGLTPAPAIDASLLAVGNRAGWVSLLRYDGATERMVIVDSVAIADRWISHIAWSEWTIGQDGVCEAMLGCAAADGSVVALKVQRSLTVRHPTSNLFSEYEFGLKFHEPGEIACEADGKAVTAMRWANPQGRNPVLIFHKTGAVHFWSAQSTWSDSKVLFLRTQKRSLGSSALCPASGICYIQSRDISVISLSDGSFHTVHGVSTHPTLDPSSSETLSSGALSAASRAVFLRAEAEQMTPKHVDRVSGAATFDDSSTFIWTYEATSPTDFSYKHDAKHVSTLVVAQMWNEDLDEQVLQDLAAHVGHANSATGQAPIDRLRPILVHLRDPQRLARLHERIIDILHHAPFRDPIPDIALHARASDAEVELTPGFGNSLATHLFGWNGVLSERLRYAIAVFCQKHASAPEIQLQFASAAQHFASNIRAHMLLTLLRHMSVASGRLDASDVFFARRTVALALTSSGPPELRKKAEELSAQMAKTTGLDTNRDVTENLDELCPACHTPVPLQDADTATPHRTMLDSSCVPARCCATFFILTTPRLRTCIGCSRKALLPAGAGGAPASDSDGLPDSARNSWILRNLLSATRRCPFCGNNFVVLV